MSTVSREEFEALKKEVSALRKGKTPKKTRKPSEYNIFVGKEITKIKSKKPSLSHQEAFKEAVAAWNKAHPKK